MQDKNWFFKQLIHNHPLVFGGVSESHGHAADGESSHAQSTRTSTYLPLTLVSQDH